MAKCDRPAAVARILSVAQYDTGQRSASQKKAPNSIDADLGMGCLPLQSVYNNVDGLKAGYGRVEGAQGMNRSLLHPAAEGDHYVYQNIQ